MKRVLLIGNSRWHWGERDAHGLRFDHALPDHSRLEAELSGWAAVGAVPDCLLSAAHRRITLRDVPLAGCPEWLGVDRAIGAWAGWTRSVEMSLDLRSGLLLVDAGTVLSITMLSPRGAFVGGQLIPGYRLQLSAMTQGTEALPAVVDGPPGDERFPKDTVFACVAVCCRRWSVLCRMPKELVGVSFGCVEATQNSWQQSCGGRPRNCNWIRSCNCGDCSIFWMHRPRRGLGQSGACLPSLPP